MVWATTATVDARSVSARGALSAFSAAAVERGGSAVTNYDTFIADAHGQIVEILAQRGISETAVSSTAGVTRAETDLVLALLFESVQQIAREGTGDQFAQQAAFFRASFESEIARAQPINNVRGTGYGFGWGRG
jgi:hypothetical protein